MQEAPRPTRVDDEFRLDSNRPSFSLPFDDRPGALLPQPIQARHVQIDRAFGLRLLHEGPIEIRAEPMGVRDAVVRARRDHELSIVLRAVVEDSATFMEEEREAALQAAGDIGSRALPWS